MIFIKVEQGPDAGLYFQIDGSSTVIGRGSGCAIALSDKSISRKHLRVENVGGKIFIVDLGSSNGTFLNGERIKDGQVEATGEIRVGVNTVFTISSEAIEKADEKAITASKSTRFFNKLGEFTIRRRYVITAITVIMVAVAVFGCFRLEVSTDLVKYFKESSLVRKRYDQLQKDMAGGSIFYVFIETHKKDEVKEPELLRKIVALQSYLEGMEKEGIDNTISITDYVRVMNREMNNGDKKFFNIPDSKDLVAQYLLTIDEEETNKYVDYGYEAANILVRHHISASSELSAVLRRIGDYCEENFSKDYEINFTGEGILINNAADAMAKGQVTSLMLALAVIFAIMCILFASVKAGFLSMVPNCFPIVINFGIMGWFGIPLNTATSTIASIAIGIAVDDTIHFMARYQRELKRTMDQKSAILNTVRGEGKPIAITSTALFLGFIILVFSDFNSTISFGYLTAMIMVTAVVADLIILPVLLVSVELFTIWDLLAAKLKKRVTEISELFRNMKVSEAKRIVLIGSLESYKSGEFIFRQGEASGDMCVIVGGSVIVRINTEEGSKDLSVLEEGEIFGETSLVTKEAHFADIIAKEDVELLLLNNETLDRLRQRFPKTAAKLFFNISTILSKRLFHITTQYVKEGLYHHPRTSKLSNGLETHK